MTLGDGVFWATLLVLTFFSLYIITNHNKWKLVGKVFAGILLLSGIVWLGVFAYIEYEDRAIILTGLDGVDLGVTEVEVILAKGAASEIINSKDGKQRTLVYEGYSNHTTMVMLVKNESNFKVELICKNGGYLNIMGLGLYSSEKDVVESLGEPKHISINSEGTSKIISYPIWNISFEIEKKRVTEICAMEWERVRFIDEYHEI